MHPLFNSLLRPHLKYAVLFWFPHLAKNIAKLESAQRKATKMVSSLRNKPYNENMFCLEERCLLGKLIECF